MKVCGAVSNEHFRITQHFGNYTSAKNNIAAVGRLIPKEFKATPAFFLAMGSFVKPFGTCQTMAELTTACPVA